MPLDFPAIKECVKIVDVLAKRGISLRFNGEWGSARCPLPSHKAGDNDKTFQVNVRENYWKCWSASCNEKAGKKGGDVINLVAILENCSEYDAAKKLADAFHVDANKPAKHSAQRADVPQGRGQNPTPKRTESNTTSPSGRVNVDTKGYMADVDAWFDEVFKRGDKETDVEFWKRARNAVKARLVLSFRNGKRVAQGLPIESA